MKNVFLKKILEKTDIVFLSVITSSLIIYFIDSYRIGFAKGYITFICAFMMNAMICILFYKATQSNTEVIIDVIIQVFFFSCASVILWTWVSLSGGSTTRFVIINVMSIVLPTLIYFTCRKIVTK